MNNLKSRIQNQESKIGIIGLGYVGLPLAIEFGKKHQTVGFDINEKRISFLKRGFDKTLEVNKNEFRLPNKNLCSVIIGGNNHHYNFLNKEADKLVSHIKKIMSLNSQLKFLILFSRRTTLEIKNIIKLKLQNEAYIWDEKQKNPYTYALKYSDWFIVTSDSTSMISECAITNKPIYVFHLPFKRDSQRIKNFHMEFENLKITKTLDKANDLIPWQYNTLNESERIASIIKERIIKEN